MRPPTRSVLDRQSSDFLTDGPTFCGVISCLGGRVFELHCTLEAGHPAGQHHDDRWGVDFPDPPENWAPDEPVIHYDNGRVLTHEQAALSLELERMLLGSGVVSE